MSKKFIKKNLELSLEFDRRVVRDPDILAKVPRGACVVITKKGDEGFNRESKMLAKEVARGGENCFEARKEGNRWMVRPFVF